MKRLLLFIVVLFGSMSAMSLADGCTAQVCTCPNGGYVSYGEYCATTTTTEVTRYYGGIAVNPQTGEWGSTHNYTNRGQAKKDAMSQCGSKDCKYVGGAFNTDCISAAYSSGDKVLAFDTATSGLGGKGGTISERKKRAAEKAMKKCEKNGGGSCKILKTVCSFDN